MKHRFFAVLSLLVIFSMLVPAGGISALAQPANDTDTPDGTTDLLRTNLPMMQRAFPELPTIMAEGAVELSEESARQISAVSEDGSTYTFDVIPSELEGVEAGDVIVGGISEETPNGFLRKVIAVDATKGNLILTTEQGTLEEAYEQLTVDVQQVLTPENLSEFTAIEGVTLVRSPDGVNFGAFEFQLNSAVLYDQDGDPNTTGDQIVADGYLRFSPTYIFRLKITDFQVQEIYISSTQSIQSGLSVISHISLSIAHTETPLTFPITLAAFPVPGLPIVVTPVLQVMTGVEGTVYAGVGSSVTQTTSLTSGLQYYYGTWRPISYFSNQFTFEQTHFTTGVLFKAYVGPKLSFLLNGVVGPYVKVNLALKLDITTLENPWLTLRGGLEVPVGVSVEFFSHVLLDFQMVVIDMWQLLYSLSTPDPGERISIPAGEFQMGCDPENNGGYFCYAEEMPLHTVYLDAYYIDTTPVTNEQYVQCVAAGDCCAPLFDHSSTRLSYYGNPEFADYPVIFVDWFQALDYCNWAGGSLPTEAQWERAARGSSDTRPFPWGDTSPDCGKANFYDFNGIGDSCVGDTSAVGSYPAGASPYGALDMAGNVWEWVYDWFSDTYYGVSPYSNPIGPAAGDYKVYRGGGWDSNDYLIRVSVRMYNNPDEEGTANGFRCAYLPGR